MDSEPKPGRFQHFDRAVKRLASLSDHLSALICAFRRLSVAVGDSGMLIESNRFEVISTGAMSVSG